MPYSYANYTGNGATTQFTIPCPYLAQAHLQVSVAGGLKTLGTDYTINTGTNKVVFSAAPVADAEVKIQRVTPRATDQLIVNFSAGAGLPESDLDTSALQLLYIEQETLDEQELHDGRLEDLEDLAPDHESRLDVLEALTTDHSTDITDLQERVVTTEDAQEARTVAEEARDEAQASAQAAAISAASVDGPGLVAAIDSLAVNVMDIRYGAVGDGSTDDTASIQLAIDAAGEGGAILIPGGYVFKTTYTLILQAGQTLCGTGEINYVTGGVSSSAAVANAGVTTALGYAGAGNITVRDITLNAAEANAMTFGHASGIRIIGVKSTALYHHQVDFSGVENSTVTGCIVNNSITSNVNGSAIQVDTANSANGIRLPDGTSQFQNNDGTVCRNIVVSGCVVKNPQSFAYHVHRSGHSKIVFTGNVSDGSYVAASLGDSSAVLTEIACVGNTFTASGRFGITAGGDISGLTIVGNTINGDSLVFGGASINLGATTGHKDVTISGNVIRNHGREGIAMAKASNFAITGNTIGPATGASASYGGMRLYDVSGGTIAANRIDGGDTTTQLGGIWITLTSASIISDISIVGNTIRNHRRGVEVRANCERISVFGNTISKTGSFGVLLGVESDGAWTGKVDRAIVSGNNISEVGTGGGSIGRGVMLTNASRSVVANNVIFNPTNLGSGALGAGIELTLTGTIAAGSDNSISGNLLDGNATSANGVLVATNSTSITDNRVKNFTTQLNSTGSPTALFLSGNQTTGTTVLSDAASYTDDAAADAATVLSSGSLYRTTAGGRSVFRKP